jgi:hypothetical protein
MVLSGLVFGLVAGCCEHGNEPESFRGGREFVAQQSAANQKLLKKNSAP